MFVKVEIRSGAATSFWFDEWSSLGRIIDLTQMQGCIALGIKLNATVEFIIQNYRSRHYRAEHLISIDREILILRTQGLTDEDDVVLWKGKGNVFRSSFDTNQTWQLTRVQQATVQWYKGLLFSGSTPKYSVISWIAVHNRLATGDRLLQWNAQANAQCILCNSAVETRNHLFFSCPYSEAIWRNLTRKLLGRSYSYTWSQVLDLISTNHVTGVKKILLRYICVPSLSAYYLA